MSKLNLLETKFLVLFSAFEQLAEALGQGALLEQTREELGQSVAKHQASAATDGRATSWTEARKQEFGEKISAAWEAKRALSAQAAGWYKYTYADEAPVWLPSNKALADDCQLALRTVTAKLEASPSGFVMRQAKIWVAYAKFKEDLPELLSAKAVITGDADDEIVLPKKYARRF